MLYSSPPMIQWILCSAVLLGLSLSSAHATPPPPEPPSVIERPLFILRKGEQRLLRIQGLKKFTRGSSLIRILPLSASPSWASFNSPPPSPPQTELLLIKAVGSGETDLWVWKHDGTTEHRPIQIENLTPEEESTQRKASHRPLLQALQRLNEVEVILSSRGVVLKGEVQSFKELGEIGQLKVAFPNELLDETEPSPELLEQSLKRIETSLRQSGASQWARVERIHNSLWIRGEMPNETERVTLERQLKRIFPPLQFEILHLPDQSPTVFFRVYLLEMKRNRMKSLGLFWSDSSFGKLQANRGQLQDLVTLEAKLNHLQGRGEGKILSQPELVVRAPGEAELFSGGELPVKTQSRFRTDVNWKNHGLTLRLKVTHIAGSLIRLDIFSESSQVDYHGGIDELPGIRSNRMKTQVDAQFGTPLFLSGLIQESSQNQDQGLPFLGQIPVLRSLFGTQSSHQERTELVAILYPYAAPPGGAALEKKRFLPQGLIPPTESWISPEDELHLRRSPDFPWNAFESS
ncbi:MAG: type II and III secretion system protein [Bdellovibrionia bacterium]